MRHAPRPGLAAAILPLLAATAAAQQFQLQAGVLPGPNNEWGEGVVMSDVDLDGDVDVVVAQGDGFSSMGTARQQRVLINDLGGTGTFLDESVARVGTLVLNAKMVIAPDVDSDADPDLVFVQAWQKQPRLLVNDGSGFFTDVTATQFPVVTMNGFSAEAGDVDNDGDLDLGFADTGASVSGGAGGQPRLFENDGSGFFTNVTTTNFPSALKVAQDCHWADVDNDFALDFVNAGRSVGVQLFLNDGTGMFASNAALAGAGSGSTYETEPADFENDGDLDLFVISQSGLNDGTAASALVPGGTLSFTTSTATVTGNQGDDDNEAAFIDFDDDGDLDAVIGSLTNNGDKFFTNNGSGTFAFTTGMITAGTDSTLDLAFGDVNGDGDLDLFTVQGESGSFADKIYFNTGSADTTAPSVPRVEDLANVTETSTGPWVARAHVTDGHYDDGELWTTAVVGWTIETDSGTFQDEVPAGYSGGGIYRGVLTDVTDSVALPGARVTFHFHATDHAGNAGTSANGVFGVCGFAHYGAGIAGTGGVPALDGSGSPHGGNPVSLDVTAAAAGAPGLLLLGLAEAATPAFGGTLLVGLAGLLAVPIAADGGGAVSVPITLPANPIFAQTIWYSQAFFLDAGAPAGVAATPGLRMVTCFP